VTKCSVFILLALVLSALTKHAETNFYFKPGTKKSS